jgi:hypothetical protein
VALLQFPGRSVYTTRATCYNGKRQYSGSSLTLFTRTTRPFWWKDIHEGGRITLDLIKTYKPIIEEHMGEGIVSALEEGTTAVLLRDDDKDWLGMMSPEHWAQRQEQLRRNREDLRQYRAARETRRRGSA